MKEWIAHLKCGHLRVETHEYKPGDTRLCPRCRRWSDVLYSSPGYRVKCSGCTYSRAYGAAHYEALRAADAHARRYPLHTVGIMLGGRTVDVRRPRTILVELPLDPPPF